MSTLRVSSINNAAASAGGIAIDSSGGVSGALPAPNRNLLYNGAMQVSQRGTSATGLTGATAYNTADRWYMLSSGAGTWTQSVENDAPTGSGFRRSLRMLCTTAVTSPAAGSFGIIMQILEGQDLQRIAKGTASAQQLTLSFWVKSNVTGTYVCQLRDNDNTRSVSGTYTIAAGESGTWVRRTITFPADATGIFDNDNAGSLDVRHWLVAGSSFTSGTLNTAWQSETAANVAVGQVNVGAATNNYWQVTGVQLEVGNAATGFEFKSFGQELRECQRYYYLHASGNLLSVSMAAMEDGNTVIGYVQFPETMRTAPVLSAASGTNYYRMWRNAGTDDFNSLTITDAATTGAVVFNNTQIAGTAGHAGRIMTNNAAASVAFSAEL